MIINAHYRLLRSKGMLELLAKDADKDILDLL